MKTSPLPQTFAPCCKDTGSGCSGSAWSVHLNPDKLIEAVQSLDAKGFFLEDILALDFTEGLEVVYHFDHFTDPGRITLRVLVEREAATVPSIAAIYPGAEWHERETTDFHGVTFEGNPNPAPLLLDPEYQGQPPLLKNDKTRASIFALFPNYDIAECRPDFVKEGEGEDAPKSEEESA